jgi:hypothetical protein
MKNKIQQLLKTLTNNYLLLTSLLIGLGGCASVPPAEHRRIVSGVRELNFTSTKCKDIGSFDGGESGMGLVQAKEALRFKVGKAGGNAVVFDFGSLTSYGTGSNLTVSGTGYKCAE